MISFAFGTFGSWDIKDWDVLYLGGFVAGTLVS
jgi:hypothetical protein